MGTSHDREEGRESHPILGVSDTLFNDPMSNDPMFNDPIPR